MFVQLRLGRRLRAIRRELARPESHRELRDAERTVFVHYKIYIELHSPFLGVIHKQILALVVLKNFLSPKNQVALASSVFDAVRRMD